MANQVMYGFHDIQHLFNERVDDNVEATAQAIDATVAEHNRQLAAMNGLFVEGSIFRSTERFKSPSLARLQPLDEFGRARPIRRAGQYGVGYPIHDAGAAWGETFKARAKMTVADANALTQTLLLADIQWNADHILAAIFANGGFDFDDDEESDTISVKGLADGDAQQYLIQQGADIGAGDDHYFAQAAAIADAADPTQDIVDDLTEHPENDGEPVLVVASNIATMYRNDVSSFYVAADPNIRRGANVSELVGSLGFALPGTVIGYHESGAWVVEWKRLPAGFGVATMTGGIKTLKMREDEVESLRGFNKVAERNDHPFYESQYLRIAGYGVYNRVGAVAIKIGAAGFDPPTGYESPMA